MTTNTTPDASDEALACELERDKWHISAVTLQRAADRIRELSASPPPPAEADVTVRATDEREAFESWALRVLKQDAANWKNKDGYVYLESEWQAWQARAAIAARPAKADPCTLCNALTVPRNATHYDAEDLAAAQVRGKLLAAQPVAREPMSGLTALLMEIVGMSDRPDLQLEASRLLGKV